MGQKYEGAVRGQGEYHVVAGDRGSPGTCSLSLGQGVGNRTRYRTSRFVVRFTVVYENHRAVHGRKNGSPEACETLWRLRRHRRAPPPRRRSSLLVDADEINRIGGAEQVTSVDGDTTCRAVLGHPSTAKGVVQQQLLLAHWLVEAHSADSVARPTQSTGMRQLPILMNSVTMIGRTTPCCAAAAFRVGAVPKRTRTWNSGSSLTLRQASARRHGSCDVPCNVRVGNRSADAGRDVPLLDHLTCCTRGLNRRTTSRAGMALPGHGVRRRSVADAIRSSARVQPMATARLIQ